MPNRKFLILLIVTIVVIICASLLSRVQAPKIAREKALLFPHVEAAINDITRITLRGYRRSVELVRQDDRWVLASSGNYPAIFDKVRALLIQFANFRVLAEKTRRPHLYYRLSVEEPEEKGSLAIVTRLYGKDNSEIASLIIGRDKETNAVNPIPSFYGRIPGTETSLLIQGNPEVSAESRDWFNTSLFHVPSEEVQEVRIEHPGEETVLLDRSDKSQPDFFLRNIPEGKKAQSLVIINRMGALLEDMVAIDVRAPGSVTWPDDTAQATVRTFDGLVIRIKLAMLDEKPWANFTFEDTRTGDTDRPAAEELNRRHADWVYQIQDFKFRDLTKHLDDLTRNSF